MADTTAADKRSVIKNATQGGLIRNPLQNGLISNPLQSGNGVVGKGNTIATKEEINQAKATQGLTQKPMTVNPKYATANKTPVSTPATTTQKSATTNTKPMTIDPNLERRKLQDSYNVMNPSNPANPFNNPLVQPVNDIKVVHNSADNNINTKTSNGAYDYNRNKLIVKTEAERKKDISAGIEALYTDAYNKATDGEALTIQDVLGNEKYRKQLDGLDEGRIQELVNDANTLAQYDEYDMQNVLSIYDKYQDMGLLLDYTKLSPNSKTAYLNAIMQANEGENTNNRGLWNYVDKINWISPLFLGGKVSEGIASLITGKDVDIKGANEKLREKLGSMKHDYLGQEEIDAATKDERAKLDEKYKQYYTVDKDGNKKWKDNGQWNKYKEEELKMETAVTREHGDNSFINFNKNLVLNLLEVASLVVDMVSEPGTLASGLGSTIVGGAENAAGYGWDVADYLKNGKWEHKEITQHMAELGGYKDFDEALEASEYKLKDSPFKDIGMGILRQLKNDTETAGMMGNYIAESYGSPDKFVQSFLERPAETISDIVTTLEGGAWAAGKLGLISPVKSAALVESLGKLDPFEQMMRYGNKFNYGPLLKSETWLLKQGGKAIKLPFKGVKNMGEMIVNKLSGLSEEERKFIRENPEDVDKFIKGEENSQSLIDKIKNKFDELTADRKKEGEEYNKIKESDMKIDAKAIKEKISEILDNFGVKIGEKGAEFTKVLPTSIENKAKELVKFVNDYNKKGDTPLASETHYLRQLVDTLANWENKPQGLEADFVNAVKDIRRTIDGALKEQVPGMKEIDAKYSALLGDIKALRQDWFNKDGTLKDTAYSKIRNLTNKGSNQPKLERLESQIPGITQDLKALAVSETVEKASKQMVGQYAQQIWGVGAPITAITSLLTGGLNIPAAVLGLLGMQFATPKNLVSLLKFGGKIDKKINGILDKIINGTKLTALETAELARYLNENKGELRDKVEYMHKKGLLDDAEYKKAVEKYDLKNQEYDRAQTKARNAAGDKEKTMSKEDEKAVLDWVKNNAKNPGWVVRVLDETGMMKALKEAGSKAEKGTQGFFYDKYINLLEHPTDTTAQHEFFHAVFSVVDSKTKDYLLQEARKILKENNMDKVAAEEWLAESFGIYAKRKMIDTGVIKTPRNFEQKLRNFFQKVYEWIQNFNGDRKTINKVFDEIYGGKKKIGKKGQLDLSFLLEDKKADKKLGVDNGLRKKAVYHGSPADFDKFDSSHMGEGEGAQAHGWGHYVAVEEGTARKYTQNTSNKVSLKGKDLYNTVNNLGYPQNVRQLMKKNLMMDLYSDLRNGEHTKSDIEKLLKKYRDEYQTVVDFKDTLLEKSNDKEGAKRRIKEAELYLKELDKINVDDIIVKYDKGRNLYNLDIPEPVKADTPTGSNYLEEEGKLTEKEWNELRDLANKWGKENGGDKYFTIDSYLRERNRERITNGKLFYDKLSDYLGSPKAASKFLESLGYDGIHYFGGRDGEAYVIFNDDALQIKGHIRYKKKIGDKEVEINKDITSPEQMAKVNSKGLSVIHDFISEKQAEKALDVSKDILDKDGNAYLWTHTNKYNDKMFANFDNTRDSKYRSFKDNQIGWLTNSEDMSKSYADQKSKLAPTKKFNSVQEVNDYFKKNPIVQKWQGWNDAENETSFKYRMEKSKDLKGNDYWKLESQKSEKVTYDNIKTMWDAFKDSWMDGDLGEMPKNQEEALRILKDKRFGDATELKVLKNGKIEKVDTYDWTYVEGYDTDQQAIAEGYAKGTDYKAYHYQGIAQNMKNPLVVDIRNPDGTQTYWNKLGNGYEFLEKNNKEGLDKAIKVIDELKKQAEPVEKSINEVKEEIGNKVTGKALLGIEGLAKRFIEDALMGKEPFGVKEEWMEKGKEFINNNPEFKELYDRAKEIYNNNKDLIELKKGFKYESNYEIKDYLKAKGVDGGVAGILRGIGSDSIADINIKDYLKDYNLETNDYVFYALSKGGYDGVLFKNISDYGGKSNLKKGGDVLAIFKSSQFKSWDNSTPTDSKYISYKKKIKLDKKSEGLQKKNSSGLLAKGRDRMGDNGMRYKSKPLPDTDNDGRKLSEGQKKFFAGSKVVDKNGNLLRVYHGTRKDFTVFDNTKSKDYSSNSFAKLGNWFTQSEKGALEFAESGWGEGKSKAMGGYLDIKNPKIYEPKDITEELEFYEQSRDDAISKAQRLLKQAGYEHKSITSDFGNSSPTIVYHVKEELNSLKKLANDRELKVYSEIQGYGLSDVVKRLKDKGWSLEKIKKFGEEVIDTVNNYEEAIDEMYNLKNGADSYEQFENDLNNAAGKEYAMKRAGGGFVMNMADAGNTKKVDAYKQALINQGYDGIIIKDTNYDNGTLGEKNTQYVAFNSNQFKNIDNLKPTKNQDIRYKKGLRDLTLNNEKKEGAYDPRAGLPKVRGGWTKAKILKQIKSPTLGSSKGVLPALQAIQEFDSPEDFRAHTFYHGTQGSFVAKPSMSISDKEWDRIADQFGGGYGERYWAISLTTDKNIASRFGGASDHVNINPVILRKNAKVIEMPNIHDSIELEDHIEKLWDDGVDAVWIGDKNAGEKELAVINPRAIVDLGAPEYYNAYMLGSKENPLKIRTEEDFNRIYENAPKYRQELRESNAKFNGLKEKFFKDNYGESQFGLMDKDYGKYKEAKAEWENSKEKEEYEKGKMEYNRKIYETKDKIRFKKKVDQTQTPEFKKWFEGSKITKPDGQPMVVYHGTADKFTVFDSNFDGKNTGNKGFYGNGFYFTDKVDDAKWYGMKGVNDIPLSDYNDFTKWEDARKEKANVMGVYLDMKKPFYWKSIKNANQVRKLANEIHVRGLKWNDYLKEMRPLVSDEQSIEFSKGLRNAGYDGVIYEGDNGTEYMVFKSNQIKSATDNIGTFDKNNPDIRYKHKLLPKQWANKGVREVGKGLFGTIYEGINNADAENFLKEMQTGEVKGAYNYKGEPVDLVWGRGEFVDENGKKRDGFGLKKLIEKHPEMLGKIGTLINRLPEVSRTDNRIKLDDGKYHITISREFNGHKKNWVLTAFEIGK